MQPTPDPTQNTHEIAQGRRRFLLIGSLFFAPLALAFLLYYGNIWRPHGTTNKGELIDPPRPLPAIPLTLADGTLSSPKIFQGKWTWAYVGDGQCDTRCRTALGDIRRARLLLVEKADRVQRIFFVTGHCCDMEFLHREHPGLIVAQFGPTTLSKLFELPNSPSPQTAGRIYLIDPLGNLMMSYAPNAPSMGMLQDIKKLLNLSHIG